MIVKRISELDPCVASRAVYHASVEISVQSKRASWWRPRWAGLVIVAGLLLSSNVAFAKKLVISEAFEITGKIQRPQAMYILQRSKLNLKGLQLKRSLIPKLLESMRKPPL